MRKTTPPTAAFLFCFFVATTLQADVVITALEIGNDVHFSGQGTLNLSDLPYFETSFDQGYIAPYVSTVMLGATPLFALEIDMYGQGLISSNVFGTGFESSADLGTGDRFGIVDLTGPGRLLTVPAGYVSGNELAGTLTFEDETFDSLGMTPGMYVWSWGSGANADSLTLNISTVPEPGSPLVLLAVFAAAIVRRGGQPTW